MPNAIEERRMRGVEVCGGRSVCRARDLDPPRDRAVRCGKTRRARLRSRSRARRFISFRAQRDHRIDFRGAQSGKQAGEQNDAADPRSHGAVAGGLRSEGIMLSEQQIGSDMRGRSAYSVMRRLLLALLLQSPKEIAGAVLKGAPTLNLREAARHECVREVDRQLRVKKIPPIARGDLLGAWR